MGGEFKMCFEEQNYGLELKSAIENLVERVPIQDLRIVATAIMIQKESGGNLAEVLDKTSYVIRERFRLKRQVQTHTAQGRLTGWILSLLPVVLGVALYFVSPEMMSILWTRRHRSEAAVDFCRHDVCGRIDYPAYRQHGSLKGKYGTRHRRILRDLSAGSQRCNVAVLSRRPATADCRGHQSEAEAENASDHDQGDRVFDRRSGGADGAGAAEEPGGDLGSPATFDAGGYRNESAIKVFYGCKVLVPLVLCLICLISNLSSMSPFFVYASSLGLGFLAPDFWLGRMIWAARRRCESGLPDVLDLLVICIEAGLSLDQATARTAEELKNAQPELCDEFGVLVLEQRAGRARADAWKHLAERTGVDSIRNLVSVLVQSEQFGTSVAKTLRRACRHPARAEDSASGGNGSKDLGQTGFSAGVFHLSRSVPGGSGTGGDHDDGTVQTIFEWAKEGGVNMDSTTIVRIISGVLFAIVLVILVQRRRTRVS